MAIKKINDMDIRELRIEDRVSHNGDGLLRDALFEMIKLLKQNKFI